MTNDAGESVKPVGPESEHAWVHEVMGAYLAGGLEASERGRFDGHVNGCPECFDAFTEARDADRGLQRVMAGVVPGEKFGEEMAARVGERMSRRWVHPMVRRAGYGVAAAVALAATGVFAQFAMRSDGMLNNPLSQALLAKGQEASPELDGVFRSWERQASNDSRKPAAAAADEALGIRYRFALRTETESSARSAEASEVRAQLRKSMEEPAQPANDREHIVERKLDYPVAVLEGQSRNADQLMHEAQTLYQGEKFKEAKDLAGKALAMDPTNKEARYLSQVVGDRAQLGDYEAVARGVSGPVSAAGKMEPGTSAEPAAMGNVPALGTNFAVTGGGGVSANGRPGDVAERRGEVKGMSTVTENIQPPQINLMSKLYADSSSVDDAFGTANYRKVDAGDVSGSLNALFRREGGAVEDAKKLAPGNPGQQPGAASADRLYARVDSLTSADGVTKAGIGALATGAGANTYAGGTNVNAGTVKVNNGLDIQSQGFIGGVPSSVVEGLSKSEEGRFSFGAGLSTSSGMIGNHGMAVAGADSNGALGRLTNQPGQSEQGGNGKQAGVVAMGPAASPGVAGVGQKVGSGDAHQEFARDSELTKGTELGVKGTDGDLAWSGKLELKNNDLIVANGGAVQDIRRAADQGKVSGLGGLGASSMGVAATGPAEPLAYWDYVQPLEGKVYAGPTTRGGAQITMASPTQALTFNGMTQFGAIDPPAGSSVVAVAAQPQPAPQGPGGAAGTRPAGSGAAVAQDMVVRKIIRNGEVAFEVRSFEDTYATVSTVVGEEGGFVSSTSSEKLANGKVRGSIVVRVPPERLDRFLMKLRALGDLKGMQIGASDVTKQYTDLDSELRALRAMQTRLEDLIKSGKGEVKDLVEAERQLGEYRVRVEKIMGEMRYYDNLVGMATLTITAYEKDIQKPTAASEQENVAMSVETEDVETKYADARKVIDEAKGRIVESELKKLDADQFAARIVADVSPEKADFVAAQLKQLGKVGGLSRDRKQSVTGGVGAPGVTVEQKETRFTVTLYNLANIAPRETAVLTVAVGDVEGVYKNVLGLVRKQAPVAAGAAEGAVPRASGRVVSSNLTGQQPEAMTADIRADVRAEEADAVLAAIKQSGEVVSSTMTENPDTANVTQAKRGIQLKLVNMASVSPKEATSLVIAVTDVEGVYNRVREMLRAGAPGAATQPTSGASTRIVSSSIAGQQAEQKTAEIRADLRAEQAEALLSTIRGTGEVMASTQLSAPEGTNATWSKRGLQLRLVNVAAVSPRETQQVRAVAADVTDSFTKLLGANGSLTKLAAAGGARVLNSQLNQSDPSTVTATLALEVRRADLGGLESAFNDAGVVFLSRNVTRSQDTVNTLDSKIRIQMDSLSSAESIPPMRTMTIGREVESVETGLARVRSMVTDPRAIKEDTMSNVEANGRVTGHLLVEVPVGEVMKVMDAVRGLGGTERVNQVTKNAQVPETRFAKERIDLTLTSREGIVESGKGVGSSVRAALATAAGALIYSLYLVLTGVLFLAPWVLIAWVVWKVIRRRKAAAAT